MAVADPNLVALADAMVEVIAGIDPAHPFTAARRFAPVADLATLVLNAAAFVAVIPADDTESRVGGGASGLFQGDYEVDVVIYARVGAGDAAEAACGNLMKLRQQIRDAFKSVAVTVEGQRTTRAILTGVDGSPAFNVARLVNEHCFVSPQTLQFRLTV